MKTAFLIIYVGVAVFTMARILLDTQSTPKTLGYILLVIALPVFGIIFYFSFGINYRHLHNISRQRKLQLTLDEKFMAAVKDETTHLLHSQPDHFDGYSKLAMFTKNLGKEFLSENEFKLLVNGEEKFPEVIRTLKSALKFIHMEYYAWENDHRGNEIKDVLLHKIREGIKVRILYDDYASRGIRNNIVKELKEGGAEIFPKVRIRLRRLANRLNHRDHRKIIIVDGEIGFIGGINISDRYDNSIPSDLYWRDTHVKFIGPLVLNLQRHFIVSWNSSKADPLSFNKELFPDVINLPGEGIKGLGQIVAGGPMYAKSNIMLTYACVFSLARKKLYITNPYFIPSESILDGLMQAALAGVDVRLLLPGKSDSRIVDAASKFYYSELLQAGVKIYLYEKGFVHAKTVVCDDRVCVIGSANLDLRSFDLNFEIMSLIYGSEFAAELERVFLEDLKHATEITRMKWTRNKLLVRLSHSISRLVSAFL